MRFSSAHTASNMFVIGLKEQLAKATEESKQQQQGGEKKLATAQDHQANPGPVISQDIGEPASKEELRKRAEELNK